MPEEFDYRQKTITWLNSRLPDLRCPLCNHDGFIVGEMLASPLVIKSVIHLVTTAPFVPVVCKNCGNTLLFSAVQMNLVPSPANQGDPDGGSPQIPHG